VVGSRRHMGKRPTPEVVEFITTQQNTDLIVSFALTDVGFYGVVSLTLLRTPKFEVFLPPDERRVHVSHESFPEDDDDNWLQLIRVAPPVVSIVTTCAHYDLDVSKVNADQLRIARQVLKRMNFDKSFDLQFA
jgi:hypothetical protein